MASTAPGSSGRIADFRLADLYQALDAGRRSLRLSWTEVARELDRFSARPGVRPLAASTLTGLRTRAVAEADGVLQMLLWLDRSPESFVPGHASADAALDGQRERRGVTWTQVAKQLGLGVASLTRMRSGGRASFPHVMRMLAWLGRPAAEFTRAAER